MSLFAYRCWFLRFTLCGVFWLLFRIDPAPAITIPEVFVGSTVDKLTKLTSRDGIIYWKTPCETGSEDVPARSRIASKPVNGGFVRYLYYPSTCQVDSVQSYNLHLDQQDVFWIDKLGDLRRLARWAQDGQAPEFFGNTGFAAGEQMAVGRSTLGSSDTHLYWSQDNGIYRIAKSGGGSYEEVFTRSGADWLEDVRVTADDKLFFLARFGIDDYDLLQIYPVTAPGLPIAWSYTFIAGGVTAYALDEEYVYYAKRQTGSAAVDLLAKDRDHLGNPAANIRYYTAAAAGDPLIRRMLVTDDHLFFQETHEGQGPIKRVPLSEGPAESITTNYPLLYPDDWVSDQDRLFWFNKSRSDPLILTLPTDAEAVVNDLGLDRMEIIQSIQIDEVGAEVPLIAGKPTTLRLTGRILLSNSGLTEALVQGLLHGWDSLGAPLPGSPLTPVGYAFRTPVGRDAQPLLDFDEGFTFRLPQEWTTVGEVTLRGEINGNRLLEETDYANNAHEETYDFLPEAPVCMRMIKVRTKAGTVRKMQPEFVPIFQRALGMLPTSQLVKFWSGGGTLEEYEFPFSFGPYEISDTDDDSWGIMVKLNLIWAVSDDPDSCDDINATTHYVGMLPGDHPNPAFNGLSYGWTLLFFAFTDALTLDQYTYFPINTAQGGVTLAHELGHNFDRSHVDCPVGDPEDPASYPYEPCELGAATHWGYDHMTGTSFSYQEAADLMSYGHRHSPRIPRWPSEFTWSAISRFIKSVPASEDFPYLSPPASSGPIQTDEPGSQILIAGDLDLKSDRASLNHGISLSGRYLTKVSALYAQHLPASHYELRAFDSRNNLLQASPAALVPARESYSAHGLILAFIDAQAGLDRVDLIDISTPSRPKLLGSLDGGGDAPGVTILQPQTLDRVADPLVLRWRGSDADGDSLRYTVRYSDDAGASWQALVIETPEETASIPLDTLPGSDALGMIEVVVSDGLLSSTGRVGQLTLPKHAPEAWLHFETEQRAIKPDWATIEAGSSVVLHGEAHDTEDGPITGDGLQWEVSGPQVLQGSGEEFRLYNLSPGTYVVVLTAMDTDGEATQATGVLLVQPKYVEDGSTPTLDGYGGDPAYRDDPYPLFLRYESGDVAEVRMIHSGNALYVSFVGMPFSGVGAADLAGIRVDRDDDGSLYPEADDLAFFVSMDGEPFVEFGDGAGHFTRETHPNGLEARVSRTGPLWNAELRIDQSRLGGWNRQVGMQVVHDDGEPEGDDFTWPAYSSRISPESWGDVVLGPRLVYNLDGDLLPDSWELMYLGGLQSDGSGDSDGDGLTDEEEWDTGTDPDDAESLFHFIDAKRDELGRRVLVWTSEPGRHYTLSRAISLNPGSPQLILGQNIPATPPVNTYLETTPIPSGPYYYRVWISQP